MRTPYNSLTSGLVLALVGYAQGVTHVPPWPQAAITRSPAAVTVDAREARPLRQALVALRSEYGWLVDYEDPIYDPATEVVDSTSPAWRKLHPSEPGAMRPAGEQFLFSLPAPTATELQNGQAQPRMLQQMIRSYATSGNPGRFAFVDEGSKRFSIAGVLPNGQAGVFGCQIFLPRTGGSAAEALAAIFDAVSQKLGRPVGIGFAAMNVLTRRMQTDLGGGSVLARTAIASALDSTHSNLVYEALYDPKAGDYVINILPAVRSHHDASGGKINVLLRNR